MNGSRSLPHFERAVIIGVGLMGGSLGMDLRQRGIAQTVMGVDPQARVIDQAIAMGALDCGSPDSIAAVQGADLVVLAAPVNVISDLLGSLAPHLSPDALVTDLGSTKRRIVESGEALIGPNFVGGHPMAGAEIGGIGSARSGLFQDAPWPIVRALPFDFATDPFAARLGELAQLLGARPIAIDAAKHDRLVALISHLPHLISFSFANAVSADPDRDLARSLAGGSYRDLMRVSAADPALWRSIFLENRDTLLAAATAFRDQLDALIREIDVEHHS